MTSKNSSAAPNTLKARPLKIGISPRFQYKFHTDFGVQDRVVQYLEQSLSHWVTDLGGLSLMIPSVSGQSSTPWEFIDPFDYARELDALILQGGTDVGIDLIRDRYELDLIKAFHGLGKPVLGVCRGHQLLNVYFGGTLISDIATRFPSASSHVNAELYEKLHHPIEIVDGGILNDIYGGEARRNVVSIHHQAIDRLGEGLQIEALSKADGIIEAVSLKSDSFVLGVQWHPEFHVQSDQVEQLLPSGPLLSRFIQSARARKQSRKPRPISHRSQHLEFSKSESLTIGVELEFQLIDPSSQDLTPSAPELLEIVKGESEKIKSEIFQSMIEVETGVCRTAKEAEADLSATLSILSKACAQRGVHLAAAGTHPFTSYLDRLLTPAPRYTELVDRNQWIARRLVIFGLHVHIGMPNSEAAIHLMNAFMYHLPLLLGLSASSPFWHGDDTGLASSRSTFFESTPTGGHPIMVESWGEFEDLYFRMLASNAIRSPKDLWWDLRPSPHFGTLEIRVCDIMPTLQENIAVAALKHAMAAHFLEKIRDGQHLLSPSNWQYRENKWRATRHGLDFDFIVSDWGETRPAKEALLQLIETVSSAKIPTEAHLEIPAGELYASEFENLRQIVARGPAFTRLRNLYEKTSKLEDVVRHNCQEFLSNHPIWS